MAFRAGRPVSLVAAALVGVALAGCESDAPPAEADPPVGPAPLRRLTNAELRNTLRDLFPDVDVPLPALPDDVPVAGFENAAEAQSPSDVRTARYEAIASLYAEAATRDAARVRALTGCGDWSTVDAAVACGRAFLDRTGRRVFRRPLEPAERERLGARFDAWRAAVDFEGAVRLTLSAMLQAPQFLYRVEPAPRGQRAGAVVPVEPYALASRLSFLLWESTPDDALLDAAGRGELATASGLEGWAGRMLADPRARRVFYGFHRQWLGLDRILLDEHAARTPEVDGAWTPATQASAAREAQLFVENVLAEGGTLRDLLTSPRAWVDAETSRLYGLPAPDAAAGFVEVALPPAERGGLLTRAAFLAALSHRGGTSPPERGNGIQLRLLCQLPRNPPPGVDLSLPKAAPGQGPQTTRMLFEERTRPGSCQVCHASLNGFGYALEGFDAAAHFRTTESGLPIDASGSVRGTDVDGPVSGALELSAALARSRVVRQCATQQWVRYALGRAPASVEIPRVAALSEGFESGGGDVRALLLGIVTSPSFRLRRVEEAR